jgi:hypothetical protein
VASPLLERMADAYNSPLVRRAVVKLLGSALAGSQVSEQRGAVEAPPATDDSRPEAS